MADPDSAIDPLRAAPEAEQPVDLSYVQPVQPAQPEQSDQPQQQQQQLAEYSVDDDGTPQQQQPPPPPQFHPLFTLVTDTTSRATHHPRVHYIFSDDDPDILTHALAQYQQQSEQRIQQQRRQSPAKGPSPSGSTSNKPLSQHHQSSSSSSPVPQLAPSDRAIVLDLVPKLNTLSSGDDPVAATSTMTATASALSSQYEVAWASSLSVDWAVVSAKLSAMPDDDVSTRGGGPDDLDTGAQAAQQQRLMLHIEGIDSTAGVSSSSNTATTANQRTQTTSAATRQPSLGDGDMRLSSGSISGEKGTAQQIGTAIKEDYGVIVDEFGKRMLVLRKVMEKGLERQRKVTVATDDAIQGNDGGPGDPNASGTAPGPAATPCDLVSTMSKRADDNTNLQ